MALKKDLHAKEIPELDQTEPYILVRFVSYHATHELGKQGLSPKDKEEIVNRLKKYHRVYISSEGPLPEKLKVFELKMPPERINIKHLKHNPNKMNDFKSDAALL